MGHLPVHIMWSTKVIVACLLFITVECSTERLDRPTEVEVQSYSTSYVYNIDVYYGGSSPPHGYLPQDINTGFDFWRQKDRHPSYKDLAAGAGGDYRYIKPIFYGSFAVKEIWLSEKKSGDGCTTDINV